MTYRLTCVFFLTTIWQNCFETRRCAVGVFTASFGGVWYVLVQKNVFIFVHRGGRAMAVWLILSRQLKQRPLKMIACFCPSWCDFSTLQSGSRNGTNPTPHFKWIWVPYVRFHGTYAHVFTIAGLHSLSEDLDRPMTPFVCRRISMKMCQTREAAGGFYYIVNTGNSPF